MDLLPLFVLTALSAWYCLAAVVICDRPGVASAASASTQIMNMGSTRPVYEPVAGIFKRTVGR
ncbi:Uncharacterised protein [Trueperella pyogenes]|nr:hypothetical protein [Trueperella pyogenes]SUO86822.1 Uncharacterised protein [Trueperella pyogenes]